MSSAEEKSAIDMAEQVKDLMEEKSDDTANDETVDWKTYTNTEFDFSVRYPKDWEVAPEFLHGVVHGATAYELIFVSIPRVPNADYSATITIYELSDGIPDAATLIEKIIAGAWDHCGEDKFSSNRCKKHVTRKMITVSGNEALFVTMEITLENDIADKVFETKYLSTFVFIEKADRIYHISRYSETSFIDNDFELFYKNFEITK